MLEGYEDLVWSSVAKRFNAMLQYGEQIFEMEPDVLVQNNICDVVKVFIKKEPHDIVKVQQGRFRIIASVSLVDQIVTRLLCAKQNKAEIKNWRSCPSAPGMGLNDAGLTDIWDHAMMLAESGTICETDVSGWDWSVQQWELDLDAEIRCLLAGKDLDSFFGFFLRVHSYIVGHSVFAMPDGELLAQTIPGGQLSGDYNTSSSNSRMRIFASLAARYKHGIRESWHALGIKAMGDDSYERWFSGLEEGLKSIGHSIKMCVMRPNIVKEGFEFCSQRFVGRGVAYPVNPAKTYFRFASHGKEDKSYAEFGVQLMDYFRHLPSPLKEKYQRLTRARVDRAQTFAGIAKQLDDSNSITKETASSDFEEAASGSNNEAAYTETQHSSAVVTANDSTGNSGKPEQYKLECNAESNEPAWVAGPHAPIPDVQDGVHRSPIQAGTHQRKRNSSDDSVPKANRQSHDHPSDNHAQVACSVRGQDSKSYRKDKRTFYLGGSQFSTVSDTSVRSRNSRSNCRNVVLGMGGTTGT